MAGGILDNIYLKSLVISAIVFSIGLFVGFYIESFLLSDLTTRTSYVESSVREIELEILYFQSLNGTGTDSCEFLNEIIRNTNNDLDGLADTLLTYSERDILFTSQQIADIKKQYTFLLIKGWLLQENVKRNCGTETVTIIYFYDTEGCGDCILQGTILTILKDEFKEKLMVFPIDTGIDLSMVGIMQNRFNITVKPSVVVEGQTFSGIVNKERLELIVCAKIPEAEQCQG